MRDITKSIYLGDQDDAKNRVLLEKEGITHILNCAKGLPSHFPRYFRYLNLELEDPDSAFTDRIEQICHFIEEANDLASLSLQGVTRVVCLQQAHELKLLEPPESIEQRKESLIQRGIGFLHEPIQDFAAPSVEQARRIVAWINTELERGEVVAVHCWAGLGRAGTIAACVLLSRGFSVHGAVSLVRYVRPGAIQSDVQEKLIAKFAALTKSE